MVTNISKSTIVESAVIKGKQDVTWDEAIFTWDQGNNSTWDGIGPIVTGNLSKSSITKTTVTKSTI